MMMMMMMMMMVTQSASCDLSCTDLNLGRGGSRRKNWIPVGILPRKTQYINPMLVYCWNSVTEGSVTLNQHWVNVSSVLRCALPGYYMAQLGKLRQFSHIPVWCRPDLCGICPSYQQISYTYRLPFNSLFQPIWDEHFSNMSNWTNNIK